MHEIHVFSGLGSSLFPSLRSGTKAVEKLIDALPYAEADHHIWNQWRRTADDIVNRWKTTKDAFKTVLIGHSNGVIACTAIAKHLNDRGLPVDYIGAIDPTAGSFPVIGRNVHEAAEWWASSGFPAMARAFTKRRRGALLFEDAWPGIHRLYHHNASHVGLASHPRVHAQILSDLKRVLG